jgi:hypothetical protein
MLQAKVCFAYLESMAVLADWAGSFAGLSLLCLRLCAGGVSPIQSTGAWRSIYSVRAALRMTNPSCSIGDTGRSKGGILCSK